MATKQYTTTYGKHINETLEQMGRSGWIHFQVCDVAEHAQMNVTHNLRAQINRARENGVIRLTRWNSLGGKRGNVYEFSPDFMRYIGALQDGL